MADVGQRREGADGLRRPLDVAGDKRHFVFRSEPSADLMVQRVVADMVAAGVKTVGFIGFSDSWANCCTRPSQGRRRQDHHRRRRALRPRRPECPGPGAQADQRQARRGLRGASGTPAAMPQITLRERASRAASTSPTASPAREFLRVGGKNVEGADPGRPGAGGRAAARQPIHQEERGGLRQTLEGRYGPDSCPPSPAPPGTPGCCCRTPSPAPRRARPAGTPEFRAALRDGLEKTSKLVGTNGVFTMSAGDHAGYDASARS